MFDVNDFLDRAKAAAQVETDYALAVKILGYKKASTVYNWRSGLSAPDARAVLKLCGLTGDDPEHVVACLQSMRAANDEEAALWQRVAARLKQGGAASLAFIAVACALLFSGVFHVTAADAAQFTSAYYVECVMGVAVVRLGFRLKRIFFARWDVGQPYSYSVVGKH